MNIIIIANPKGGIGKSTTAVSQANISARSGKKTLLIDLDSNRTSTNYSDIEIEDASSAFRMFSDNPVLPSELARLTKYGYDIIQAGTQLFKAEYFLGETSFGEMHLSKLFKMDKGLEKYDSIYLDTGAIRNRLLVCAMVSSDNVLVPIEPDPACTDQLPDVIDIVESVSDIRVSIGGKALKITAFFFVKDPVYTNEAKQAKEDVIGALGDRYYIASNNIPRSTIMSSAVRNNSPITEYQPTSLPAQAYMKLFVELESRM